MKQLILIRHAKSDWNELGASDFERSLNHRGKHDAPIMGKRLAARLASDARQLDAFVCSSARRAEQTAMLLAPEIGFSASSIDWRRELYLASPATMLQVIRALSDAIETAVLLAHNPGISELAERLTRQSIYDMPTCGMVTIALPVTQWVEAGGRAELTDFDFPKKA
ncbi:MAG: histidine phosphatase family protein [Mariprofundus sp.]